MGLSNWFKNVVPNKKTAPLDHYKSGIHKAEKKDHQGAIEAYSRAIEHPATDDSLKSMALYNRALVLHVEDQNDEAVADLQKVIKMHGAHTKVKTAAKSKLNRINKRTGQK
ncbi:MAG: tetratricopeptide repeat protein [Mariniblastus sp.]|nr:tetratricopeptide repeat protein [Mariniblastus sp.]